VDLMKNFVFFNTLSIFSNDVLCIIIENQVL